MEHDVESAVRELAARMLKHNARLNSLDDLVESLRDRLDSALQELREAQGALEDRQQALPRECLAEVRRRLIAEARMA